METSEEFVGFMDRYFIVGKKHNKRKMHTCFNKESDQNLKIHSFTKMLNSYALVQDLEYKDQSSGGQYYFWIRDKKSHIKREDEKEEGDNLQSRA